MPSRRSFLTGTAASGIALAIGERFFAGVTKMQRTRISDKHPNSRM